MNRRISSPKSMLLAALGLALLAAPLPRAGSASMTAPNLAIGHVEVEAGAAEDGALVTVEGAFPFDDLAGRDYAMQLFIRAVDEGSRFICFSTRWGPMAGSNRLFEEGLDEENVFEIGRLSTSSDQAHFVRVEPGQLQVQLEPDFPEGRAEAQFFVVYNGVPVFSNPVSFQVGGDVE